MFRLNHNTLLLCFRVTKRCFPLAIATLNGSGKKFITHGDNYLLSPVHHLNSEWFVLKNFSCSLIQTKPVPQSLLLASNVWLIKSRCVKLLNFTLVPKCRKHAYSSHKLFCVENRILFFCYFVIFHNTSDFIFFVEYI